MKTGSRDLRNKIYQLFCCAFLLLHVFLGVELHGHGFAQGTLIKAVDHDWWSIEHVCRLASKKNKPSVASYDLSLNCCIKRQVKSGMESETNCYFRIGFDDDQRHDTLCTPTQEFYIPSCEQWVPAYALKIGDALLGQHGQFIYITHIEFIEESLKIYLIEVCDTHNFFVGYHFVLTHNVFVPVFVSLGLGGSFGSGAAVGGAAGGFFGPITFVGGIVVGGLIGIAIKAFSRDKEQLPHYQLTFDTEVIDVYLKNDAEKNNKNDDAQAPGKPTENDGFHPPKRWDGKKVKNPNGGGYGWPDKKGSVWIPTGPNGHGCPHWDVEHPDGSYDNVLPGGRIRGKK